MFARMSGIVRLAFMSMLLARSLAGQSDSTLAKLLWSAPETSTGRFLIVPGQRSMVAGYRTPGLEVWAYPLQIVRDYWPSFRVEGTSADIDGRTLTGILEHTPTTATRIYDGPGFAVHERVFTPTDLPAATITYSVRSSRPVTITLHFTPSLNLMWPAGIGGQEIHWDSAHFAYILDEPSHRFRAAIMSRQIVAHDPITNDTHGADFERSMKLTLRPSGVGSANELRVTFAGSTTANENPLAIATALAFDATTIEQRTRARYSGMHVIDIETPDSAVNRAIRWAQVTLEQAWVCNPQLGCGQVAGYGPSRGARRPQYAWFFGNDGLVAIDALLREGAYERARDELTFIIRYQNRRTGAVWHELSQSAGFLDWEGKYPYMFVHVDVTFQFLDALRDYVQTTGDVAFGRDHWRAIRAAYDYCRSTIPANGTLPNIPVGQEGANEQDPQRDELVLSLGWVSAAESFAELAKLTGHGDLAVDAMRASQRARDAIRPSYYDAKRGVWASGHLRSGAPVEGITSASLALLHHGLLPESERRVLLDSLAAPSYRANWGIRSTPTSSPFYDPDSYARGSVWAIGTGDAINAFYEGDRAATGTAVWLGLVPWLALDAPGHMHEVLRGDSFVPQRESVPDQTWSAAGFVSSVVRGLLGIQIDALRHEIRFAPHLPPDWRDVRVDRIRLAGSDVGLSLRTTADSIELECRNAGGTAKLGFVPFLPTGRRARAVQGAREKNSGEFTVTCAPARTTRATLLLSP